MPIIWDVTRFQKWPLPAVKKPSDATMQQWFDELADKDPNPAYKAVWRFVAIPHQTLPFFAKMLTPVKSADPKMVRRLIDDLDSPMFKLREKAARDLELLGEFAVDELHKAKKSAGLEKRKRIDLLLARQANIVPSPEQLRAIRAVAVLEQIDESDARKVLSRLADGAPRIRLTEEARAALDRLK